MSRASRIDAAIENARDCARSVRELQAMPRERRYSARAVRAIVLALLEELPDDMTVADLRDELWVGDGYGCCLSG